MIHLRSKTDDPARREIALLTRPVTFAGLDILNDQQLYAAVRECGHAVVYELSPHFDIDGPPKMVPPAEFEAKWTGQL